jgi:hypothetical protein
MDVYRALQNLLSRRLAPYACALVLASVAPSAHASDPIARPFEPLNFRNQTELLRSLTAFRKIISEVPYDAYRCMGLLSKDGWTGRAIRKNPEVAEVLENLFKHRLSRAKTFEKLCARNSQADFGSMVESNYGVCAGLTSMTWLANYLALFDGEGTQFARFHPESRLPKGHTPRSFRALLERKDREWHAMRASDPDIEWTKQALDREDRQILAFYAPFIDRLFRERKPTVLPFFDDLETFSGHASLMAYLNKHSMESWFDVNVSLSSIIEILLIGGRPTKKMRLSEIELLDAQIRAYLEHRIQPVVFINLPAKDGREKAVHVLRVIDAEWADRGDRYTIKVVDPNYDAGNDVWRIHFRNILRSPDDILALYQPYKERQREFDGSYRTLTEVEMMPYFDRMSAEVLGNWATWLRGEGGAILDQLEAANIAKKRKKRIPPGTG